MKVLRYLTVVAAVILLATNVAWSQISAGGTPVSFQVSSKAVIDVHRTGSVDVQRLLEEDARAPKDEPFRFGAPFDVQLNMENSGTWETLSDGSRMWRLKIESPGAYSINLLYDRFYLPDHTKYFIYTEDRSFVIGAFTSRNNKEYGRFATQPVKGDAIILEYWEPAGLNSQPEFQVSRVVHAYKNIFAGDFKDAAGFGDAGACNNNVNCPEGADWYDEKRAVAMVLLGNGFRYCSGVLVNSEREDLTPYFLTANHCLNDPQNFIIMFNYESPDCSNIDGPTTQTIHGTTLRANYSFSDFALLQLSSQPPHSYNVYYAGWSTLDDPSDSVVAIHHPSGDIKKISFDFDAVTATSYLGTSIPGNNSHWRVGQWEDGTTEGGSSGSPIFNRSRQIIGQLHGGYASCASITSDWYGKFSQSWNYGSSSSTRLLDWLDPDNTGILTLNGREDAGLVYHVPGQYATIQAAIDAATDGDTVLVQPGTYTGSGNTNVSLNGKRVVVTGTDFNNPPVIDCQNSSRAFVFNSHESRASQVRYFKVINGYDSQFGGAVYITNSSPHIDSCIFENCSAPSGGALYMASASAEIKPELWLNWFTNCQATAGDGGAWWIGQNSVPGILRNVFTNCSATGNGGAVYISPDPGIYVNLNNSTLDGCTAGGSGSALYTAGNTYLLCNTIVKNSSAANEPVITLAGAAGIEVTVDRQNIVSNNGVGLDCSSHSGIIGFQCNNYFNNPQGNFNGCQDSHSNTLFTDPYFCDFDNGNYTLQFHSPCDGRNTPCPTSIGAFSAQCGPAPSLVSPANGTSSTNSAPTFDWSDVNDADLYQIQIDETSDVLFPERDKADLTVSEWQVSPGLTVDTWYWRARAYDAESGIWGAWSEVWTYIRTSGGGGGGSSCPVLFAYSDGEYRIENPLLTACEKSNYTDIVTDYYQLTESITVDDGIVRFEIREMEDEISYIRDIELITVDHSEATAVACSPEGEICTFSEILEPISVVDQSGKDWTEILAREDGEMFTAKAPGHLVVTFPATADGKGLSFATAAKNYCPIEVTKAAREKLEIPDVGGELTVEVLGENGDWKAISDPPPREYVGSQFLQPELAEAVNGVVTYRFSWTKSYNSDAISQVIQTKETPSIRSWEVKNHALKKVNPQTKSFVGKLGSDVLELRNGDILAFEFDVGPAPAGVKRDYIVRAVGRYHPDYSLYTNLLPGGFQLYANYPNPFNPSTTISFDLPAATRTTLTIYNVAGQRVATLVDADLEAGHHNIVWNGKTYNGADVASGVYLYRLTAGDFTESRKMMLLK